MDLSKYYAEICRIPMLSKAEETELFARYYDTSTSEKEKAKIKERVISANLRFAFKQAKMFSKNDPIVFEDLISSANEGLTIGFDKYRPGMGTKYLSYAGWWVNQRILYDMSKMRIVGLPIWKQQLIARIQKVKDNNENMSIDDLVKEFEGTGIKRKDIEELYDTRYLTYYIDDLDENEFEIDPIGNETQKRLDENFVLQYVHELPSPHREVIAKCFGLEDVKEHSTTKISRSLKVSKEEIQRIKLEAMEMLKQAMIHDTVRTKKTKT